MSDLKIHSDKAWEIASHWSDVLASDTRTLAAAIDVALAEARDKALEEVESLLLSSANDMLRLKSTEMAIANNLSLHFVERHNWYCGVAENVRALKEKP